MYKYTHTNHNSISGISNIVKNRQITAIAKNVLDKIIEVWKIVR